MWRSTSLCLNYEVATYSEAAQKLPPRHTQLETEEAIYYFFKADILAGLVSYSTDRHLAANIVTLTAEQAAEVIEMNRRGERPASLTGIPNASDRPAVVDLAEQDSLTRFDKSKRRKRNRR